MPWIIGAAILYVFFIGIWVGREQMKKNYKSAAEVREWLLGREKSCDERFER